MLLKKRGKLLIFAFRDVLYFYRIFIETQDSENECISGSLKILSTISRKKSLKKVFFYLQVPKKVNEIYFCSQI